MDSTHSHNDNSYNGEYHQYSSSIQPYHSTFPDLLLKDGATTDSSQIHFVGQDLHHQIPL